MDATPQTILAELQSLGNEKIRAMHRRNGAQGNVFGVMMGDIRKLATRLKTNHALALDLWQTGNLDARLLAILLLKPKDLTAADLDRMVREADMPQLADWFNSYVIKDHPERERLREGWMDDVDPWAARAGWSLTAGRVARQPDGLDIRGLLNRIEREMATAHPARQWTMNNCLAGIGIHMADHRERAIAIGERLGVYRDFPVSKGCTSPFAPIWIAEMVRRQE